MSNSRFQIPNFKFGIPCRTLAVISLVLYMLTPATNLDAASTPATNSSSGLDFSTFKIITDRNIFNPRRSARSVTRSETRRTSTPKVDSFALVGTMSYEKGPFAFFEGSQSEYRKALKPEDTIAGFKVAEIQTASRHANESGGRWPMEPYRANRVRFIRF
jgi:hypothetical protein